MANITASDVKRLRESTGAGMMDCKNALMENDGDFDKAVEYLRVKGQAGVAKREGRATANGLVATHTEDGFGVLVEVNCETDFVAKGERFQDLGRQVLEQAVAVKATDVAGLLESSLPTGGTVSDLVVDAIATIGEKIQIGRLARIEAARRQLPAQDQPRPAPAGRCPGRRHRCRGRGPGRRHARRRHDPGLSRP